MFVVVVVAVDDDDDDNFCFLARRGNLGMGIFSPTSVKSSREPLLEEIEERSSLRFFLRMEPNFLS